MTLISATCSELAVLTPSYAIATKLRRRQSQAAHMLRELATIPDPFTRFRTAKLTRLARHNEELLTACLNRLDVNKVVSPPLYRAASRFISRHGDTAAKFRAHVGLPPRPKRDNLSIFGKAWFDNLAVAAAQGREAEFSQRLLDECAIAHNSGWYFVFNTLTVSDMFMDDVFAPHSPHFKNYIRRVYRSIGAALGQNKTEADRNHSKNHRYFAVVEYGDKFGRLHIHVLHACRALPKNSFDPNGNDGRWPLRREVESFKNFWDYGISKPLAVRYGAEDAFSRAAWKWPVEKINGAYRPLKAGDVGRVASYVAKYINKQQGVKKWLSQNNKTKNLSLWRVRMTRGFGVQWIRNRLQRMPTSRLLLAAMERKTRMPKTPELPSWRRCRKEVLRLLAIRKQLGKDFVALSPRKPMPLLFKMTPSFSALRTGTMSGIPNSGNSNPSAAATSDLMEWFKNVSPVGKIFCAHRQGFIDRAIRAIIERCQLPRHRSLITGAFSHV